jgi:hypothetical protein
MQQALVLKREIEALNKKRPASLARFSVICQRISETSNAANEIGSI